MDSWMNAWTPISGSNEKGWVHSFADAKNFMKYYKAAKGHFIGNKKSSNFGLHLVTNVNDADAAASAMTEQVEDSSKVHVGLDSKPKWMVRPQNAAGNDGLALSSYCLRFKDISGSSIVPTDGIPFLIIGTYKLDCMYGRNKHLSAQRREEALREEELQSDHPGTKKRRRMTKGSKKKGCPAKITMKEVIIFPQFQLEKEEASSLYAQGVMSREVREAIRSSTQLVTKHRIYISVPKDEDHEDKHPVGMLTGFPNPLYKDLIDKVQELVGHGVTDVKEMKRHLKIHVETILFPNPKSRPTPNDMAYYPSDRCVRNQIYAARMKLSCPKMSGIVIQAETWSGRMWNIVQRASSFVWEVKKKLSYIPFIVNGTQVGIIPPIMMETVVSQPDLFEWKDNKIHLSPSLTTYAERTARVAEFLEKCQQSGNFLTLNGWRNENYAVSRLYYDTPLLEMERSATCLFGIKQYGVHVNGYCRHPTDGMCMWIGKRSPTKQTYPGKLDQIAAGGLPAGLSIKECMMKESEEEANVPQHISSNAVSVGAISYFFEDERGLFPETQFIFDLELPADFQPTVKDGEVSEFYLWPLSKVKEEIAGDEFKPNCSLVCLDFLIRHGFITPDDEPRYLDFLSRIHQTHF